MKKKILVITGSPRRGGNSEKLAEAFVSGVEQSGHEVNYFDAAFHNLSGCLACDKCWSKGSACIIEDDFTFFSEQLEQSDVIVFAYPLYWSAMPSQLKRLIDRLYAYCSPKKQCTLEKKGSVLLICGECEGDSIFEQVRSIHTGINGYLGWESIGEVMVDGVFEPGAIENTDGLLRAIELGKSI